MYDLIIRGGTVYDGSGKEGFSADVAVKDGKIVAVGAISGDAATVLEAKGLAVTPGFIDSHSHSDSTALTFPQQIEKAEQGITTSIGGQCGSTVYPKQVEGKLVPMSDFLRRAAETPQGSNLATFVGHSTIRKAVMGMENRKPTEAELEQMKDLLREAMDAGAIGVSFGMIYTPGCYAQTDELIAMAQVAKEKGGMISAHIRNEADRVIESVEEFITVAKAANIRGVVSHHKSAHKRNHGKVNITLKMLEKANAEGCDLYCDVYPYIASHTRLAACFIPNNYVNGSLSQSIADPQLRSSFKEYGLNNWGEDLSWVQLVSCTAFPEYSGLMFDRVAQMHGKDHWDTLLDILEAEPGCRGCFFTMREEDVETVMAWNRSMICTDSSVAQNNTIYHPRLRGSFPRVLGRYVRQRQVVSLPEMIRKITSLPAHVYDLKGKGTIAPGYDADICVFDPETILDRATYTDVAQRAQGLNWVIVGGKIVAENAVYTGKTPGKILLRNPHGN